MLFQARQPLTQPHVWREANLFASLNHPYTTPIQFKDGQPSGMLMPRVWRHNACILLLIERNASIAKHCDPGAARLFDPAAVIADTGRALLCALSHPDPAPAVHVVHAWGYFGRPAPQ